MRGSRSIGEMKKKKDDDGAEERGREEGSGRLGLGGRVGGVGQGEGEG